MNKKFESFLNEQNFNVEENGAYSFINDYQVAVGEAKGVYGVRMPYAIIFSHLKDEEISSALEYLKSNKKALKLYNFEVTSLGVTLTIGNYKYANLLDAISNVTAFLKEKGTLNKEYCPFSGEAMDEATKKKLYYHNAIVFLNESSVNLINEAIEKEEEAYRNAPNNYLKGTVGAIVGGALGAVVWIVVGALLNLISGWIAFLIAFLAGLGYDKMKGKANYTKLIVSGVVTLAYVVISTFLIYVIVVNQALKEAELSGNAVSLLFEFLKEDAEIRSGFITDMVLGLLFGVIGLVYSFLQMKKTLHQKQDKLQ